MGILINVSKGCMNMKYVIAFIVGFLILLIYSSCCVSAEFSRQEEKKEIYGLDFNE